MISTTLEIHDKDFVDKFISNDVNVQRSYEWNVQASNDIFDFRFVDESYDLLSSFNISSKMNIFL